MGQFPPREPPPNRPQRRELPRPERPFDRLLRRRPERDPAPIIIGGTIAFLAIVIILVFLISSVLGGGGDGSGDGQSIDIAPGIRGRLAQIPALPPGLEAASQYIEFEIENENSPAVIGLPLRSPATEADNLGFYTFLSGRWQRQANVELLEEGRVAQGDFTAVPGNLAVLRVVSQTYIAAGSLPSGATLHADANVNIVNPRDFSPAADGSIAGQGTPLQLPEEVEIIPTIVGSGADAAQIVNTIIGSQDLQSAHIQAIVSLVESGGYDGIDLEYASVNNVLDDEFTIFVNALATELRATGAKLSLTLPPPTGRASAYDMAALGQAADYIRILPLANPVRYWDEMPDALNRLVQDVDPRKVLLVVSPFSVETVGDVARPMGYLQAMVLAAEAAVREPSDPEDIQPESTVRLVAVNMDEGDGSSPITWNDEAAALNFTMGGADRRTVYIENAFSIGFKLEFVQAYGFLGAAVSDASAQSDVPELWPTVNELTQSATVTLVRPNESSLVPMWQAEDGEIEGGGAGTSVTWTAPEEPGSYTITLVVSDGVRRFGRELVVDVGESDDPDTTGTPIVTLPPEEETPTPTAEPTVTPTPEPETVMGVEIGLLAEGDGDGQFTNDEFVPVGATITYLVTIDNDSNVPVEVTALVDNTYGEIACLDITTGENVIGTVLQPDDGDGPGVIDGGADEVQCTYTATAPESPDVSITNVVTGSVQSTGGQTAADQDDATITTVAAAEE